MYFLYCLFSFFSQILLSNLCASRREFVWFLTFLENALSLSLFLSLSNHSVRKFTSKTWTAKEEKRKEERAKKGKERRKSGRKVFLRLFGGPNSPPPPSLSPSNFSFVFFSPSNRSDILHKGSSSFPNPRSFPSLPAISTSKERGERLASHVYKLRLFTSLLCESDFGGAFSEFIKHCSWFPNPFISSKEICFFFP